jgi:hypothetical protein
MNPYLVNIKKILVFVISLILCTNVLAQNETNSHKIFVRVYDLQNKKIGKGKILAITESSIQLIRRRKMIDTIPASNIGLIKTNRSEGHHVLVCTVTGAATLATAFVIGVENDKDWVPLAIISGAAIGSAAGAVVGLITYNSKNSIFYEINGDLSKWNEFKIIMNNKK